MKYLLAGLSLLGIIEHAWGKDAELRWSAHENAGKSIGLSYARPNSDVGLLWIWCEVATGIIEINPSLKTSARTAGEQGSIVLTTLKNRLRIEGRSAFNELSDAMEMSGKVPEPLKLATLFRDRGNLRVVVPGNYLTVPLNGQAQKAFEEFSKSCPSLR